MLFQKNLSTMNLCFIVFFLTQNTMMQEPAIKTLPERHVAFVSFVGNYMANPQVFKDLFEKLGGWAGPKGLIGPDTVFLSAYYDDPNVTPPDELRLEVCMTVPEDTEVGGDVDKKTLPGGEYVVMNAELSSPEEFGPAWMKVVNWAKDNEYKVDMSRASYEVYLNNPEDHPEKHYILDVCFAVTKA